MTNSHCVGKQTELNTLIPPAINTVTPWKTKSLNREAEHKSWVVLVGFAVSNLSCLGGWGGASPPIQLTEASKRSRSIDEIPVSRCSQEESQRKKPIAYSRRDLGAGKYPPGAQRVGARTSETTSSIALLGCRREQWWRTERRA